MDEAQYAKDWVRWAKAIYDSEHVKLFISGSTTALLEKDAYTSLTGRWRMNLVWPLDLSEFLKFRGVEITGADRYLEISYLREYVQTGGFPEAVLEENEIIRSRILVELFEDMVLKGVTRTRNLRDTFSLKQIAMFLTKVIGKPASVNKMQNTFKLSAEAISNYIDALCSAYLFFPCPFYSKSINKRIYNPKKYYIIDPGMAREVLGKENTGATFENLLALHYHKLGDIGYWKSEVELDLVLDEAKAAIESKFKSHIDPKDMRGGLSFVKKRKLDSLYVATDDYEAVEMIDNIEVKFIPVTGICIRNEGP